MDYQTVLEKAVLEYAASASAHPKTRSNGSAKIPGFMDDHVWAMAMQAQERGHVLISKNGAPGVTITEIQEEGRIRLKEITEMQEEEEAAQKARLEDAQARADAKKWWKRPFKKTPA